MPLGFLPPDASAQYKAVLCINHQVCDFLLEHCLRQLPFVLPSPGNHQCLLPIEQMNLNFLEFCENGNTSLFLVSFTQLCCFEVQPCCVYQWFIIFITGECFVVIACVPWSLFLVAKLERRRFLRQDDTKDA